MTLFAFIVFSWFFQARNLPPAPAAEFILEVPDQQYAACIEALQKERLDYSIDRIHRTAAFYRLHTSNSSRMASTLQRLSNQNIIAHWQFDWPVETRSTPNDPLYTQQWNMQRIGLPEAWNFTTGGVTVNGDTIVVAVLDDGFESTHSDLRDNLWVNKAEIPGDGIDNDNNGYIDDYRGINVKTDTDIHTAKIHGTSVAGIVGARGNNQTGITGVNWNVKIMLISGIQNESDIIEGYLYAKAMRDSYASSSGTKGAFVVATNLSAGIDNALPEDHEMWCDQYDAMGNSGILSVCATTNANTDVDVHGDMPTTCQSAYMIAVTNTDMDDKKPTFAGYGLLNIDLGAPGTPSLSTSLSNDYEDFEGTSAAAPHVAGTISLLYAAACDDLLSLADTDPSALALQMKNLIMTTTDPLTDLTDITVSGGRLNAGNAMIALLEQCSTSGGTLEILSISPNPAFDETTITYHLPDPKPYELDVYDSAGRLVYKDKPELVLPGDQTYTLLLSRFVPGVYVISLLRGKEVVSKRLLVQ